MPLTTAHAHSPRVMPELRINRHVASKARQGLMTFRCQRRHRNAAMKALCLTMRDLSRDRGRRLLSELKETADRSLTFELDLLGTVLRRVGKRQAIGGVDLSGDHRMEHDCDFARLAGA
jgi:hypothetical protein